MTHTEGPWERSGQTIRSATGTSITRTAFNYCADVSEDPEWHEAGPLELEATANARLIAAAPDLLAALKALLESIESVDFSDGMTLDRIPWVQAEDAITKAKEAN